MTRSRWIVGQRWLQESVGVLAFRYSLVGYPGYYVDSLTSGYRGIAGGKMIDRKFRSRDTAAKEVFTRAMMGGTRSPQPNPDGASD